MGPTVEGEFVTVDDALKNRVIVPRIEIGIPEIDWILGRDKPDIERGLVPGSLVLLCGDPGIGKSTVLMQIMRSLGKQRVLSMYVSGEEDVAQLADRASRLGAFPKKHVVMGKETDIDRIFEKIDEIKPSVVAMDSIQTVVCTNGSGDELEPGSPTSIKCAIREFMDYGKKNGIVFIVIGHVTKDGAISGPRALEHYVDVSIYFSGEKTKKERELVCGSKNRFGETPRSARFNMTGEGLVAVVEKEAEKESEDEGTEEPQTTQPAEKPFRKLRSVPPDPGASPITAKADSEWVAADGTTQAAVLRAPCPVTECGGKVDRACTSANGTKEAGFHQARVLVANLKMVSDAVAEIETPEPPAVDPFKTKPLGAPPRAKKPATKKTTKRTTNKKEPETRPEK